MPFNSFSFLYNSRWQIRFLRWINSVRLDSRDPVDSGFPMSSAIWIALRLCPSCRALQFFRLQCPLLSTFSRPVFVQHRDIPIVWSSYFIPRLSNFQNFKTSHFRVYISCSPVSYMSHFQFNYFSPRQEQTSTRTYLDGESLVNLGLYSFDITRQIWTKKTENIFIEHSIQKRIRKKNRKFREASLDYGITLHICISRIFPRNR